MMSEPNHPIGSIHFLVSIWLNVTSKEPQKTCGPNKSLSAIVHCITSIYSFRHFLNGCGIWFKYTAGDHSWGGAPARGAEVLTTPTQNNIFVICII